MCSGVWDGRCMLRLPRLHRPGVRRGWALSVNVDDEPSRPEAEANSDEIDACDDSRAELGSETELGVGFRPPSVGGTDQVVLRDTVVSKSPSLESVARVRLATPRRRRGGTDD